MMEDELARVAQTVNKWDRHVGETHSVRRLDGGYIVWRVS